MLRYIACEQKQTMEVVNHCLYNNGNAGMRFFLKHAGTQNAKKKERQFRVPEAKMQYPATFLLEVEFIVKLKLCCALNLCPQVLLISY